MELQPNMYVRTKDGIGKITRHEHYWLNGEEWNYITTDIGLDFELDEILKASYNIIDLLEVGDYVNGSKLLSIDYAEDKDGNCDKLHYYYSFEDDNKDINEYYEELIIKSIVTKKQFESMSYKVGE